MVRDPRGTHNSRSSGPIRQDAHDIVTCDCSTCYTAAGYKLWISISPVCRQWCRSGCADPAEGCADLLADLQAALQLETLHPGTVHLVRYALPASPASPPPPPYADRYEDLSRFPEDVTSELLDFLELPFSDEIEDFIQTHTNSEQKKFIMNKKSKRWRKKKKNPYGTIKAPSNNIHDQEFLLVKRWT